VFLLRFSRPTSPTVYGHPAQIPLAHGRSAVSRAANRRQRSLIHRTRGGSGLVHMLQRASVGDIRAARMAGSRPAMAPIARAEARPPAQARGGMTVAQCWVWA